MSKCKNCCKEFKYQWCLDRHLRRKIPCLKAKTNHTSNKTINPADETTEENNPAIETPCPGNETQYSSNETLQCKYCYGTFSRSDHLKNHIITCKEKDDVVRILEMQLDIQYKKTKINECRFCNHIFSYKTALTRHKKTCKAKQEYRESLEEKLELELKEKAKTNQTNVTNNHQTINNIMLNVSAETLRKFGEENTDHISNAYLLKTIGRLGVTLPKVVSTVAKHIYCNSKKPENQTIQITNVRSQWAKVSNGENYELQTLGESVKGVRNKVTDLYVERQCDYFDYFQKVNCRIDKLDDLNNQNYTARTMEDKEDQKNASKLRSDIDREIKSTLYNVQKSRTIKAK